MIRSHAGRRAGRCTAAAEGGGFSHRLCGLIPDRDEEHPLSISNESTREEVRDWARGMYPLEAGVELLIRAGRVYDGAPWVVRESAHRTYIDRDALESHMGMWSGGEQRIARIALSLLGGDPVRLDDDIPGLDRPSLDLVLAALAHANGSHEHSGFVHDA